MHCIFFISLTKKVLRSGSVFHLCIHQYPPQFLGHRSSQCSFRESSNITVSYKLISYVFCLSTVRSVKLKEDILSCTFAELSLGLCQFIQEVRRPNGEKYDPDSILYLCLGIQQVSNLIVIIKSIAFLIILIELVNEVEKL